MRTARCFTCGADISRYAATCPHCRTPQPQKRPGSTVALAILVGLLALAALWAMLG